MIVKNEREREREELSRMEQESLTRVHRFAKYFISEHKRILGTSFDVHNHYDHFNSPYSNFTAPRKPGRKERKKWKKKGRRKKRKQLVVATAGKSVENEEDTFDGFAERDKEDLDGFVVEEDLAKLLF